MADTVVTIDVVYDIEDTEYGPTSRRRWQLVWKA